MAESEYEYYSEEEPCGTRVRSHSHTKGSRTAPAAAPAHTASRAELEAERAELVDALRISSRGSEPLADMDSASILKLKADVDSRVMRHERELARLEEMYRAKKETLLADIAAARREQGVVATVADLRVSLTDVNQKIVAMGGVEVGAPKPSAAASAAASGPVHASPAAAAAAPADDDPMRPFTTKELSLMFRTVTAEHPGNAMPVKVVQFMVENEHLNLRRLTAQYMAERDSRVRTALLKILFCLNNAIPTVAAQLLNSGIVGSLVRSVVSDDPADLLLAQAQFLAQFLWSSASDGRLPQGEVSIELVVELVAKIAVSFQDIDETLFRELTRVLLTLNLHYDGAVAVNPVLGALATGREVKALVEEIPRLLNRGVHDDSYAGEPTFKLLEDIFSNSETVDVFYPNDLRIILDVLMREIVDQDAGAPLRTFALRVLAAYIANSDYAAPANQYRIGELQRIFDRVLDEEGPESEAARMMVESIYSSCEAIALHKPTAR